MIPEMKSIPFNKEKNTCSQANGRYPTAPRAFLVRTTQVDQGALQDMVKALSAVMKHETFSLSIQVAIGFACLQCREPELAETAQRIAEKCLPRICICLGQSTSLAHWVLQKQNTLNSLSVSVSLRKPLAAEHFSACCQRLSQAREPKASPAQVYQAERSAE